MRVVVRKKNLEITPALSVYIDTKIVRPTEKLLARIKSDALPLLDIEVARTTRHHRKGNVFYAEANLSLGSYVFRAEAEAEDIYAACDLLEDELKREISKFKTKIQSMAKRQGRQIKKQVRFDKSARLYRKGRIREEGV